MTVEPGIYFIPALINTWKKEKKFMDFINYDALVNYMDFGGIRIEDDILITDGEPENLSGCVPRTVDEIEAVMKKKPLVFKDF